MWNDPSDGDNKVLPVKPTFFDKKRLSTDEFKNYIYEIEFKKTGKKVRDMSAVGYIHAITPFLKGVHSELLHYGTVGDRKIMAAVVRSTITVSYKTSNIGTGSGNDMTFTALADGDATNVPSSDTLIRTVETRALKRAIARALDISKVDLNEDFVEEDEIGTSLNKREDDEIEIQHKPAFRKTPQEIAREKERKRQEQEEIDDTDKEVELDEELAKATRDPYSGSTDSDW